MAPNATDDDIKRAYRRQARELHPDANGGDAEAEAKFKEVTLAYEVLRDPERRARYDRYGPDGVFGHGGRAGGAPFDFDGGLGDLFEAFFGTMGGGAGRGRRRGPVAGVRRRGRHSQLAFAEAVFGAPQGAVGAPPGGLRDLRRGRGPARAPSPSAAPTARGPARSAGSASRCWARW